MECLKNLKEHLIAFESKVEEILNYVTEEPPEIVIENLRNHVVLKPESLSINDPLSFVAYNKNIVRRIDSL